MELEKIKDKLSSAQYNFFNELKEYIELPIYFIGSILRYDYFKGYSDLDIYIFSLNPELTKLKLKLFLNIEKKDKMICININNTQISGYKLYYNNSLKGEKKVEFDLSIFKENTREIVTDFMIQNYNIPYYYIIYFLIIKTLYYYIGIINKDLYSYLKNFVWDTCGLGTTTNIIYYDEYIEIYKKNKPNVKYMINI